MSNMPWFRSYSEILSDRKIVRICRITNQPKVIVVGLWITLLALANDSPERGKLLLTKELPYSIDDIVAESELPKEDVIKLLDAFRGMDMINGKNVIEITNWGKRQFKSDDSTKRVQEFRERQAETLQDTPDETLQKRSETVIEQNKADHIKVEEEEGEINPSTPTPSIPFSDPKTAQAYSTMQDHTSQDVAQLYRDVTGQMQPLSANIDKAFSDLELVLDFYPTVEDAIAPGKYIYDLWCKKRSVKTGKTYSPLNIAWIEKWLENLARDGVKEKATKQRERSFKTKTDADINRVAKKLSL